MFKNKSRATVGTAAGRSEYEWSFNSSKIDVKMRNKNPNQVGYFFLYFALSIIRIYLVVYVPAFLLNILLINRSQLAFIQVFVYLVMFLGPILGYLFDRYTKNKKLILISSIHLFLISFLFTVLNGSSVGIFGLFLALNLIAQKFIEVIVSKIIIESSKNEHVKDGNLAAINISSNIGSFIPSVIFLFTVNNIFDVNQWNVFFIFGFLSSLPIILSIFLIREKTKYSEKKKEKFENEAVNFGRSNTFNLILLFLSYLFIWSDKLYQFPFSSWILTKFGEEGFNIYSLFYIILILLNISGWVIGQRISKKNDDKINKIRDDNHYKRNIIAITVSIYIVLNFMMAFSDFLILMVVQGIIQVVAGIMMLNYVSLMMAFSNIGKYKTFKFQCLKIAYAFSCVVFIPLGTYFSAFIEIEILIVTVGFLSIIALVPLVFLKT